jgi:hypothetical protein
MSFGVEMIGLPELLEALRQLPEQLKMEAGAIIEGAAERAQAQIYQTYPKVTGNLRRGLALERAESEFGVSIQLLNKAKHAYIYEIGTAARHYITKENGVVHATGAMPAGNVFVPIVIRNRTAMYEALARLIEAHGLEVSVDAAA